MRVVKAEQLEWQPGEGCKRALVHSDGATRVEMLEVSAGATLSAHHHKNRREVLCVVFAGGSQIRLADRVFRPIAGMTFEREPGEPMEIVNDTMHPMRILVTQFGYDAADTHAG